MLRITGVSGSPSECSGHLITICDLRSEVGFQRIISSPRMKNDIRFVSGVPLAPVRKRLTSVMRSTLTVKVRQPERLTDSLGGIDPT